MIPITRPFLPPFEEFVAQCRDIWDSGWVTNLGPKTTELERRLSDIAGVGALYVSNGTLALNLAARALELRGDVLTTPFTFVATASAMAWEGCTPRFVDIDEASFNLDPTKLAAALTPDTTAIVATHVYGNPCDHEALQRFANEHGLRLIYDAAHAFGTTYRGQSLFSLGDVSTCSFQATKLFHTAEGGAVFSADPETIARMNSLRDFGGRFPPNQYVEPGINAKNSEIHAALGLTILAHMEEVVRRRQEQGRRYREALDGHVQLQQIAAGTEYNHAYVPVAFRDEAQLHAVVAALGEADVHPRRYFYPSLSTVSWAPPSSTPVADRLAPRVLCLPVFHTLQRDDIDRICDIIRTTVATS